MLLIIKLFSLLRMCTVLIPSIVCHKTTVPSNNLLLPGVEIKETEGQRLRPTSRLPLSRTCVRARSLSTRFDAVISPHGTCHASLDAPSGSPGGQGPCVSAGVWPGNLSPGWAALLWQTQMQSKIWQIRDASCELSFLQHKNIATVIILMMWRSF